MKKVEPIVISQDAYKALCEVLEELVCQASAGQRAIDCYGEFITKVIEANPNRENQAR